MDRRMKARSHTANAGRHGEQPAVISLLRGVNVGGRNLIRMEALRALYGSLGLLDVQSYVQSGNVVFRPQQADLKALAGRIESAIEQSYGFRPCVILRTAPDLRGVVERNPFATRSDIHPGKLVVGFLAAEPPASARGQLLAQLQVMPPMAEEVHLHGRELYIYFPDGMGRSKLSMTALEKLLKISCTARNWNTVTKLLEMAERLESRDTA